MYQHILNVLVGVLVVGKSVAVYVVSRLLLATLATLFGGGKSGYHYVVNNEYIALVAVVPTALVLLRYLGKGARVHVVSREPYEK